MTAEDVEVDFASRTVRRAGRDVPLTRSEYALFEILFRRRGSVVTRAAIWEHLYDEPPDFTSNVINVLIRSLRRKIDRDCSPPLILTSRGEGYQMRAAETAVPV
ncbi:winged helix-turn-helix transcriptional regulator [bacterium]|nr:winged helix-turn-helix transcriptional regulator [bacterium]